MANYSAYVQKYPDLMSHYNKNIAASGKTMDQWGAEHWKAYGNKEKRTIPGMSAPPDPMPSFTPEPGAATLPSYEDATMLPPKVYYGSEADTAAPKTASSYVDLSPDLASAWALIDAANQGKDVNTLFADKAPHPAGLTPAQQAEYWQKRGATSKEALDRPTPLKTWPSNLEHINRAGLIINLAVILGRSCSPRRPVNLAHR